MLVFLRCAKLAHPPLLIVEHVQHARHVLLERRKRVVVCPRIPIRHDSIGEQLKDAEGSGLLLYALVESDRSKLPVALITMIEPVSVAVLLKLDPRNLSGGCSVTNDR